MLYDILKELGVEFDIDMGESVYTGLVNDTGNFSYTNVSPKTFRIAADLRELGVNNREDCKEFYDKKSFARLKNAWICYE